MLSKKCQRFFIAKNWPKLPIMTKSCHKLIIIYTFELNFFVETSCAFKAFSKITAHPAKLQRSRLIFVLLCTRLYVTLPKKCFLLVLGLISAKVKRLLVSRKRDFFLMDAVSLSGFNTNMFNLLDKKSFFLYKKYFPLIFYH